MNKASQSIGLAANKVHAGVGSKRRWLARNILVVAALVLISTLLAPTSAVESATPSKAAVKTLEGTLKVFIEDDFERGKSKTYYYLKTGKEKRTRLKFSKDEPKAEPGAKIKVKGRLKGQVLTVDAVEVKGSRKAEERTVLPGPKKVAVILSNFQNTPEDDPNTPENENRPWSKDLIREGVFTNPDSVNAYYKEDSGYDEESGRGISLIGHLRQDGDVFG